MLPRVAFTIATIGLSFAQAQQVITTVAGTDFTFPNTPLPALAAPVGPTYGVTIDLSGNLYVSDIGNNLVFRVDPAGALTIIAGNRTSGFSGDNGPATSAALNLPYGVALDSGGNLYIADADNHVVRRVTPAGVISTIVGNGTQGYSGDGGPATSATLFAPQAIAMDAAGDIFVADTGNSAVRKVTSAGIISTVAGNGTAGYSGDGGAGFNAQLNHPESVAVDATGNLFIADYSNNRVRKVAPSGIINTVAGNGKEGYSGDGGVATEAELYTPGGVLVDASGNLFVADSGNNVVRKVAPSGIINTVAGNGEEGYSGDGGPATLAMLNFPSALAVDAIGDLFVADSGDDRIRKVAAGGTISTVVGNGAFRFFGDGGLATSAALNLSLSDLYIGGVTVDYSGNLLVADALNSRVRKVSSTGIIDTLAGNGIPAYLGDNGPAVAASLDTPAGTAVDSAGNVYIADFYNCVVRKVTPTGVIITVAGTGHSGYSGDGGLATYAKLDTPSGVAVDVLGNLFIADRGNSVIRKVTPAGIISTVAGNGSPGYSGDGGSATSAKLNLPFGVAVDASDNLFIADPDDAAIRKVTPAGIISTVAGNGTEGYSGDGGSATKAALDYPYGVAVDPDGTLFIADSGNSVIRKVTPEGIISTIAGSGMEGYSGDGGIATSAALNAPLGVALDTLGNLYIADSGNNRIRAVLASAPAASVAPNQLQFTASSNGAPTTPQAIGVTSPVNGLPFSVTISSGANWLQLSPASGASPRLIQVTADPTGLAPNTYQAAINISTPDAIPAYTIVTVTFIVTAAVPPTLSIDKQSLSFPFPAQGSARSQAITVSNTGGGTLQFTATATTNAGGNWLSVSPTNAQALPGSPVTLSVTANPAGLSPGAYSGQVTVMAGALSQSVSVTMTISTLNQAILLSQSGLSFLAVQAGGVVPAQSFAVQNIGVGVVNWTASTTTLTGGNWLQVTPSSGSSDASAETSPRVSVGVDASALSAGVYYGVVRVDAPGAANTPQVLTVFLQVLQPGSNVPPAVQPAQLLFTAPAGGESPGSQLIEVYNIVSQANSFQSQVSADSGLSLITLPQDATLDPQQPTNIVVQPITTGLNAGVYNGTVTLQFSDGTVSAVQVSVIVSNQGATSSSSRGGNMRPADSTGCTPSKLVPALNSLGQSFQVSAGWPAALIVSVKDDCGNPMPATGSVMVSFSNGDQALSLTAQGAGSWESTWQTGNAIPTVTLTVNAANQGLTGSAAVKGTLASQQQPPVFPSSGIVSAATAVSFTALAPGSAISIYGNMLAESAAAAQTLPLPSQLVNTDTQVFVTGKTAAGTSIGLLNAPLYYVSPNQVNALIPYGIATDTNLQLLVQRGPTASSPVQFNSAQAQPAIFSATGETGGAGLIQVYPAGGGTPYLANANAPAHAGDTIVVYCTGLGTVNPAVADGAAPGPQLSNTTSTPLLMIGEQSAHVNFSGLAPIYAGLYQVNAVVPSGTQTGATVPVTLSIDGQTSPLVTLAIQ